MAFAHRVDSERGLIVWYFAGRTNSEADWQAYCDTFAPADALGLRVAKPCGVLLVERENAMPDAKWRKRMAEASATLRSRPSVAFASASPLLRGMVTAVNWFRPPRYEFTIVSTFDEAIAWVEQRRDDAPGAALRRMLEECKAEVGARA